MDRSNNLSRISAICRADHWRAMWAIAWLLQNTSTEVVRELLAGLEEHARVTDKPGHFEAYRERWGRLPD